MTTAHPHLPLYTAAQTREFDRRASETHGIPGYTLMQRAGTVAFAALRARWPQARRIVVVCGTGNNGGDGYVLARLARAAGCEARVLQVGAAEKIRGDALTALRSYRESGGQAQAFDAAALGDVDVLVDALFGTGLERAVSGEWRTAIEALNAAGMPVLAIDVPSGLHADSGAVLGIAVRAALTVSFIGRKRGLYTGVGRAHAGTVVFDALDVPADVCTGIEPGAVLLANDALSRWLAPRARDAHKGDFGHVLVIGGEQGMAGAARLAGEAAVRVGAGLVSIATRSAHAAQLSAVRPELMCHGVEQARQLAPLLERASVVAIGPGLGRSEWARALLGYVLDTRLPLVLDADALNLLAHDPVRCDHWVLTPHPGEAARLLNCDTSDITADRYRAVCEIAARYGGTAVLKGAGTLIARADAPVCVCDAGNPGMASGGMGDVLTGVIAGLIAQGLPLFAAAQAGVLVHALAGDAAAGTGERGLLASDLLAQLRRIVNPES